MIIHWTTSLLGTHNEFTVNDLGTRKMKMPLCEEKKDLVRIHTKMK
jgi:hypothetical protein